MVDFSQRIAAVTSVALGDMLSAALDDAIAAHSKAEYEATRGNGSGNVAKKRIGSGYIGVECARELGFRYHKHPKEDRPSSVSKGELQRHADSGHWAEEKTAEYLRLLGFVILTHKSNPDGSPKLNVFGKPEQIGWKAARDPDNGQYRMAGEVDGAITFVPPAFAHLIVATPDEPCIWENKKATDKKWKKFSKDGVKKADPKYHGQVQSNMAYMGLKFTLFSMLNLDNMKYYFEVIAFDQRIAQTLSDRAVQVLESNDAFEMPQLGYAEDDNRCRFCDFHGQCWKGLVLKAPEEKAFPAHEKAALEKALAPTPPRPVFNPNFKVS